ncbi:MAG: glycosyltransferase, partial [Gemmatimonadota bacterium]
MTYGGAELRTLDVMRAIDPREVRFHFCTLSGQDGTLDDTIRAAGGTVNPCPLDLGFPHRFARLLTEREIDVVHSHVHYPSGLMMRVAARRRVPVRVTHFRNTHDGRRLTPRRRAQRALLRRWIDRYATDILAVSEGAMSEAWHPAGRRDGRCRVIYNGIDIEAFAGPADPAGVRD